MKTSEYFNAPVNIQEAVDRLGGGLCFSGFNPVNVHSWDKQYLTVAVTLKFQCDKGIREEVELLGEVVKKAMILGLQTTQNVHTVPVAGRVCQRLFVEVQDFIFVEFQP
jgi:hypothetical protein